MLENSVGDAAQIAHLAKLLEERLDAHQRSIDNGDIDIDEDNTDFVPISQRENNQQTDELVTIEDPDDSQDSQANNQAEDMDTSQTSTQTASSQVQYVSTFPFEKRIRELCDLISHATYEAKDDRDFEICRSTCEQLTQLFERFVEGLSNQQGLIELRDKRYKTLKQLTRTARTFHGKRIIQLPHRASVKQKNKKQKRVVGDIFGMTQVNETVKEVARIKAMLDKNPQVVEQELWDDENAATDTQLNDALLNATISGDIYMHELDKQRLKQSKLA